MPVRRRLPYAVLPLVLSFLFLLAFAVTTGYLAEVALAAPAATGPNTTKQSPDSLQEPEQAEAIWTICASGCDFTLIQDAIDSASVSAGDTLLVDDAVHTEGTILVDKDLTIRGQGAGNTTVQAGPSIEESGAWHVFQIVSGTTATLEGMTIRHGWHQYELIQIGHADDISDAGDSSAAAINVAEIELWAAGILNSGTLSLDDVYITENRISIDGFSMVVATATAPITSTARAAAIAIEEFQLSGAGIYNDGTLLLTDSTVSGNQIQIETELYSWATADAGTITETAIVISELEAQGVGVYNASGASLELWNSTISGNQATVSVTMRAANELPEILPEPELSYLMASGRDQQQIVTDKGAGTAYILNEWDPQTQRTLTLEDMAPDTVPPLPQLLPGIVPVTSTSTVVVSATSRTVAGLYNAGTATIHFSTIAGNESSINSDLESSQVEEQFEEKTGGIYNSGTLNLDHTIVDALPETLACNGSTLTSLGYNLDSDGSCALSETGDQSNVDPHLAPLNSGPGSTPTHGLLLGSPAIDAGDPACPTAALAQNDQHGLPRPADGDGDGNAPCDTGAVELQIGLQLSGNVAGQVQVDGEPGNTFTVLPAQVTAGATLTYTFNVYNAGSSIADNVRLEHYLPSGLQTISATLDQGSCETDLPANPAMPFVCQLGAISAGETVAVSLIAQVAPSVPDGAALDSEAVVSSDPADPYPNNNSITLNSTANSRADISVEVEQQPMVTLPGQPISYTFTVHNIGPSDAATAEVSNILPLSLRNATWQCAATGGASCSGSGTGDVEDDVTLPAGASLTYAVEATASCAVENGSASASSANEPYTSNNSDTVNSTLYCAILPLLNTQPPEPPTIAPDLVVASIDASPDDVEVVIENAGNSAATEPFWVELYVDPQPAPDRVNQLWQDLSSEGIAWGVTDLPLAPGEQLALRYEDAQYSGRYSDITWPLEAGTALYVQVDSFNASTNYGALLESHEMNQETYNNISGPRLVPDH
jgi:uncharacterized repeat protein (TIGR01451 family)